MVPAKLHGHLESNHANYKKRYTFFKRKLESLEKLQFKITKIMKTEHATEVSFCVSYSIACHGESHTIGETVIKPCVKDIVSCALNEEYAERIDALQLSNKYGK